MVLGPVLLAAVVASGPTAELRASASTSTYDEAACEADAANASLGLPIVADRDRDDGTECRKPSPPPAFLDCNDPMVSVWVGDMIGTCDMPKSASPMARQPARLRAERPSLPLHHQSTVAGADDRTPIGVSAFLHHLDPALLSATGFWHSQSTEPVAVVADAALRHLAAPRLDRPPRA